MIIALALSAIAGAVVGWCAPPRRKIVPVQTAEVPAAATYASLHELGTRHPIRVMQIGPDHRWVVACQAREDSDRNGRIEVDFDGYGWTGDRWTPYLFIGGVGEGFEIDAIATSTDDGRWVVAVDGLAVIVIDTETGTRQIIEGAQVAMKYGSVRVPIEIDSSERYLLYVPIDEDDHVVIRELATGRERTIATGYSVGSLEIERGTPWAALGFYHRPKPKPRPRQLTRFWLDAVHVPIRVDPGQARALTCGLNHGSIGGGPWSTDAWLNVETGELYDPAAPFAHDPAQLGGPTFAPDHIGAEPGVDDHERPLREVFPRPAGAKSSFGEIFWGPLRWDAAAVQP